MESYWVCVNAIMLTCNIITRFIILSKSKQKMVISGKIRSNNWFRLIVLSMPIRRSNSLRRRSRYMMVDYQEWLDHWFYSQVGLDGTNFNKICCLSSNIATMNKEQSMELISTGKMMTCSGKHCFAANTIAKCLSRPSKTSSPTSRPSMEINLSRLPDIVFFWNMLTSWIQMVS